MWEKNYYKPKQKKRKKGKEKKEKGKKGKVKNEKRERKKEEKGGKGKKKEKDGFWLTQENDQNLFKEKKSYFSPMGKERLSYINFTEQRCFKNFRYARGDLEEKNGVGQKMGLKINIHPWKISFEVHTLTILMLWSLYTLKMFKFASYVASHARKDCIIL